MGNPTGGRDTWYAPKTIHTYRDIGIAHVFVAVVGWFGIFTRKLYAAPRWIEPWDNVAQHAAEVIREGGIVIGNNPSFFFYMTYALPDSDPLESHRFAGLLPKIRRAGVYDPTQWLDAGRGLPRANDSSHQGSSLRYPC